MKFAPILRAIAFALCFALATDARADATLLNASYDVAREFYKEYNPAFARYWKQKTGETVKINQSHDASSKQARSVADGLEADVVSMNQASDIDMLVERGGLIQPGWRKRLPYGAVPYISTSVFLVRKGNPKKIRDWYDLAKPGVAVIIPNPKTAGNGRYTYLAAWAYVVLKGGSEAQARDFVSALFKNVPVLDTGGRGATTTFAQRGIGDVLVTFENEVFLIKKELGDQFEIVYPSVSVIAENPVSVVDKWADKKGTRKLAQAYLEYLFSEEAQEIAARQNFRPQLASVAKKHAGTFKKLALFSVDEQFGGWQKAQKIHFDDGGLFDQIYQAKK
jgi:sulfate transport system substrate-binding protein